MWLYSIGVWIMATCNYAFMVYVLFKNSTFEMLLVPLTKTMAGFDIGKLSSIHHNNFVNKFLANNINLILMILLSARFVLHGGNALDDNSLDFSYGFLLHDMFVNIWSIPNNKQNVRTECHR